MTVEIVSQERKQRTIKDSMVLQGQGIHTGDDVMLRLVPAEVNEGISLQRIDLPEQPKILLSVDSVVSTERCTTVGGDGWTVSTLEHLLSALHALRVDNITIQLDGGEVPILSGGSDCFIDAIISVGVCDQEAPATALVVREPVFFSSGAVHLVALPSDELRISYTLNYPSVPAIGTQYQSIAINSQTFIREIAPCRTFCLYEEVEYLRSQGLIKGGDLSCAVVVNNDKVMNKDGLHFPDEMVRHKILDLIGDLLLLGRPLQAHVLAVGSGHSTNVAFAKALSNSIRVEKE